MRSWDYEIVIVFVSTSRNKAVIFLKYIWPEISAALPTYTASITLSITLIVLNFSGKIYRFLYRMQSRGNLVFVHGKKRLKNSKEELTKRRVWFLTWLTFRFTHFLKSHCNVYWINIWDIGFRQWLFSNIWKSNLWSLTILHNTFLSFIKE